MLLYKCLNMLMLLYTMFVNKRLFKYIKVKVKSGALFQHNIKKILVKSTNNLKIT